MTRKTGRYWVPVAHETLIDEMREAVQFHRWTPAGIHLTVSKDAAVATVRMVVVVPGCDPPDGTSHVLGAVNDLRGHRRLKFYCGLDDAEASYTFAEVGARKHTSRVDLRRLLRQACVDHQDEAWLLPSLVGGLRATRLLATDTDALLMDAARARLIPFSRVGKVDAAFRALRGGTSWDLLKCFAKVLETCRPAARRMEWCVRFAGTLPTTYTPPRFTRF